LKTGDRSERERETEYDDDGLTQVRGESEELLADEHVQGKQGCVAQDVFVIEGLSVLGWRQADVSPGFRDVYLISFHGGVIRVMTVVGNFPAKVRCPEERVSDLGRKRA